LTYNTPEEEDIVIRRLKFWVLQGLRTNTSQEHKALAQSCDDLADLPSMQALDAQRLPSDHEVTDVEEGSTAAGAGAGHRGHGRRKRARAGVVGEPSAVRTRLSGQQGAGISVQRQRRLQSTGAARPREVASWPAASSTAGAELWQAACSDSSDSASSSSSSASSSSSSSESDSSSSSP
jgi:hypothetical protein